MVKEQDLKKGDIIMYKCEYKPWYAYGRIAEDGSDWCDYILGDGDSSIEEADVFYESSPFVDLQHCFLLKKGDVQYNFINKIFELEDHIKKLETSATSNYGTHS